MRVRNLFGAFSALGTGKRRLAAATTMTVIAAAFTLGAAPAASADTSAINFETPTYTVGDINGQDGWSKTGAYDVAVVTNTYGHASFGSQTLRMSNYITSGAFGDQTFSKSLVDEAGESGAVNGGMSGGTRQPTFDASFDFASTQLTQQDDMYMSVSPDRGDGARMSYLRFEDQADGIHVFFDDYRDVAPLGSTAIPANGCSGADDFTDNDIATISRGVHNIRFHMKFVDGQGNDVVKIYIDGGAPVTTGTSWEDYFRYCEASDTSRTVDSLLFREGGADGITHATNQGLGFLVDNLNLTSGPITPSLGECPVSISGSNPTVYTLLADCVTNQTIVVPQNAGGSVFNGNSHSITGVDPSTGRFLGAVVQAQAGSNAITVKNLTVTVSNLAEGCDAGNDRLRGILFDGVGGAITNNHVTDIEQGTNGESGCQEGNAIDARNAPFTGGGTYKLVSITGNQVTDYQKTGIAASGAVTATISNNSVTGDGAINYIAQNGIQVGYGAKGTVTGNTVTGNAYSGANGASSAGVLVVGGPCFGTGFAYTVGLSIKSNALTQNDVGVWLFNADDSCNPPALKTNNTVKFNTISNTVVTNTTGFSATCGYQAGIGDVGHKDALVNNSISGFGYTRQAGDCTGTSHAFLRFIDTDSSARAVPSNK